MLHYHNVAFLKHDCRLQKECSQRTHRHGSKHMCPVYLQCLETQKKKYPALELQIWSQQNYTMNRSWDNLFGGFLSKCCSHNYTGNLYTWNHQSSTRTHTDPWRKWLKEMLCNFGRYGQTFLERVAKQLREASTTTTWCTVKFYILSSNRELSVKQRESLLLDITNHFYSLICSEKGRSSKSIPKHHFFTFSSNIKSPLW